MQEVKSIPETLDQASTSRTTNIEDRVEKWEHTNKENNIDVYGNREGRHNKQKKIVINPSNGF